MPLKLSRATAAQWGQGKPGNKFGAVKTRIGENVFDSKREAARWVELCHLETAREIKNLIRQVTFQVAVNGVHVCDWIADFEYWERRDGDWHVVREDCKGMRTPVYRLKKKLMLAVWGMQIRET